MEGIEEDLGIIPRTADFLFNAMNTARNFGWGYSVKASFLEIYNEVLYDLLDKRPKTISIHQVDHNGKTEILFSNLVERVVGSAAELRLLMQTARTERATAATGSNDRSLRSHAVTCLEVTGTNVDRQEKVVGVIKLIDLAASEKLETSAQKRETNNINVSLSHLRSVITALLKKQPHIPYRNSKLTHMLADSLNGDSKTLMFANVSPLQEHMQESIETLKFAASVSSCILEAAKKNIQQM
jgi:kinesin family member C1